MCNIMYVQRDLSECVFTACDVSRNTCTYTHTHLHTYNQHILLIMIQSPHMTEMLQYRSCMRNALAQHTYGSSAACIHV